MSTRSWRERVEDILDAIAETQLFVVGMTFEQFKADAKTRKAVMTNYAIIGEAAGHIPSEITSRYTEVPWAVMRSMRNWIVHVYFSVEPKILWATIQDDLPPLVKPLRGLLAEKDS